MAGPPTFGPYRALRELGRGGMGVVYEVERVETGGRYALKTLSLDLAAADPDFRARFAREAQLAARLDHPHVVRTHAADLEARPPWIVQDLLPGGSLEARLRREGPLPVAEAVDLARKVALALAHAHARGVLHRDVKPENVLLDAEGQPRLVDFGLARPVGQGTRLSLTGTVLGTPVYMAPEQALGEPVDARADVYAAGALLHTLLAGRPPFRDRAGGTLAVLEAVISGAPEPLRAARPDVPPAVEAVVRRAMARRAHDRYASADELAAALGDCLALASRPGARRGLLALSGAALAAVGVAAAALAHARPPPAPPADPPAIRLPDTPPLPALAPRPDWTRALGGAATYRVAWHDQLQRRGGFPKEEDNLLELTLAQGPPAVVDGRAVVAARVSRLRFRVKVPVANVHYDSDEGPPREAEALSRLTAVVGFIEAILAAEVRFGLDLRTGATSAVGGLPPPPVLVGEDREGFAILIIGHLAGHLEDRALAGLLANVLRLYPDANDVDADLLKADLWGAPPHHRLVGSRLVSWDPAAGRVLTRLSGELSGFIETSSPRRRFEPRRARVQGDAEVRDGVIVRTRLEVKYGASIDDIDVDRDATFTFELLEGGDR
ncbi:MAG: serine/threonine protein kinase [Planctomycetes bacterium]|nr:serine/threonine protein kinase [Planctomycetota bacterium]